MDHSAHEEEEIPIPMSSTYVGGHTHTTIHENNRQVPNSTNGPLPLSTATMECNSRKGVVVKYKECLKNHAASIGGNATDGCGEFMPSGGEGTLEALKCSACNCHRNFHRREVEGESSYECYHHLSGGRMGSQRGLLVSGPEAFGYHPRASPHHMIMPLGAALQSQDESDEMEGGVVARTTPMVKKRFRTKFTAEQKERMLAFAEKVGWRLQKLEDSVVQQVCQEIGVKRRVLKVWMHNNKHNLAKKNTDQPE